jgi:CO dehydrogenase maturation factor
VQHLLVVSDPTQRGIVAAERIAALRSDLDVSIENAYLIVNRLAGEMPAALAAKIDGLDIPLLGTIPEMPDMAELEYAGRPLVEMDEESPVYAAVAGMLSAIL